MENKILSIFKMSCKHNGDNFVDKEYFKYTKFGIIDVLFTSHISLTLGGKKIIHIKEIFLFLLRTEKKC